MVAQRDLRKSLERVMLLYGSYLSIFVCHDEEIRDEMAYLVVPEGYLSFFGRFDVYRSLSIYRFKGEDHGLRTTGGRLCRFFPDTNGRGEWI